MSDFEVNKIGFRVPMTEALLYDDTAPRTVLDDAFDRGWNPWRYSDRNPFPIFAPFALVVRAEKAMTDVRVARGRVRDAWSVLLGREVDLRRRRRLVTYAAACAALNQAAVPCCPMPRTQETPDDHTN